MFLKVKLFFVIVIFFSVPLLVRATVLDFYVDSSYDYLGRSKISASLHQIGERAYFFVEDNYYYSLNDEGRKDFSVSLKKIVQEFDEVIYPQLRATFGSEWKPGIDNDEKITVLFTQIKGEAGGYFNSADEFSILQSPNSNEREMVYLNAKYVTTFIAKSLLAHEFMHLITFNQKERVPGVPEEVWLNEARSEYAPTLLGYDQDLSNSNLQKKIKTFLQKPNDSLTEWKGEGVDYGVLNVFTQYLVDHYGVKILVDSLNSNQVGIPSLEEALKKNGYQDSFGKIFTNWTVAVLVNNCNFSLELCYLNQGLKYLRISPQLNFLPSAGESTLSLTDYVKNWAGNWYKFIGGQGVLKLEFIGDPNTKFEVPILLEDSLGNYSLDFLKLENSQRGTRYFLDFGKKYISLTIIPSLQSKISGFNGLEQYHKFLWTASIINDGQKTKEEENNELIKNLLEQIARLQFQIAELLAKKANSPIDNTCREIKNNLYFGLSDNAEVRCLQDFLKKQGQDIYPEGLATGNFGSLTAAAVIRFQEKYASEILTPLSFQKGTGFVGQATRTKINQLLKSR